MRTNLTGTWVGRWTTTSRTAHGLFIWSVPDQRPLFYFEASKETNQTGSLANSFIIAKRLIFFFLISTFWPAQNPVVTEQLDAPRIRKLLVKCAFCTLEAAALQNAPVSSHGRRLGGNRRDRNMLRMLNGLNWADAFIKTIRFSAHLFPQHRFHLWTGKVLRVFTGLPEHAQRHRAARALVLSVKTHAHILTRR